MGVDLLAIGTLLNGRCEGASDEDEACEYVHVEGLSRESGELGGLRTNAATRLRAGPVVVYKDHRRDSMRLLDVATPGLRVSWRSM